MFRVLKPGAKLSFLDYVQLPAYNPSDAKHHELLLKAQGLYGREGEGLVVLGGGFNFFDWTLNMVKMSKFTLFCSGRTDAFWLYNMYIFHWKKDNNYDITVYSFFLGSLPTNTVEKNKAHSRWFFVLGLHLFQF